MIIEIHRLTIRYGGDIDVCKADTRFNLGVRVFQSVTSAFIVTRYVSGLIPVAKTK